MTNEEKQRTTAISDAAAEAAGRSDGVARRTGSTVISGDMDVTANGITTGGNAMAATSKTQATAQPAWLQKAATAATNTRRNSARPVGSTWISGDIDVTANGENVKDAWIDNGSAEQNTAGLHNLKQLYSNPAYSNPKIQSIDADDSGKVTLNGKDSGMNAADYANGASRNRTTAEAWQNATGEPLMQVSTYSGLADLGDIVKYNDDKVTIGGIEVPYAYIDSNGRAYASKSIVDAAIAQVRKNTGIQNPTALTADTMQKYQNRIDSATDKVVNRKAWNYNPESDPAYQAYAKQYARNAEQAYNRAMGSGGLYGSGATSFQNYQALAGYGDQMQRLTDVIPTLQSQDYQRYSDEQQRNLQALEALQSERQQQLSALTSANDNAYNRYNKQDELNYSRRQDALYNDPAKQQSLALGSDQLKQSGITTDMFQANADQDFKNKVYTNDAAQETIIKQQLENAYTRALQFGGVYQKSDMDKLGIKQDLTKYPLTNGYPNPYDGQIALEKAMWEQVDKPKAQFTASLNAMY